MDELSFFKMGCEMISDQLSALDINVVTKREADEADDDEPPFKRNAVSIIYFTNTVT